jgi:hypothetical protein
MITPFVFFIAIVIFRIIAAYAGAQDTSWLNFSPLAAIALCGPMIFPRRMAFILPLAILLVSDIILNAHFGVPLFTAEMVARYGALALIALLGFYMRSNDKIGAFLLASVASSTGFYLITNTVSWLTAPEYAKSLSGWFQSLTIGLPGFPPTMLFFRNSLISDLCFTTAMLGCLALARKLQADHASANSATKLSQ